jgi:hypothetical protein
MESRSLKVPSNVAVVSLLSGVPSLIGTRSGIGLSWDSTDYIAVGLSMAAGRGALDVTGEPMVIRPPGVSAFVAFGDLLSVSPDWSLRIVNAVSMMFIVWCTHILLERAQVRTVARWLGITLVAASPALLDIFTMAWSEPPFLALLLLALVIVTRERTWPWDLLLAAVFTLLFFMRYVGPFYAAPLALTAALVQLRQSGVIISFLRAGTALVVSHVVPWLWLMRNVELSGHLTGPRAPGGGWYLDPLKTFTGTLGGWLVAQPPIDGSIYLNWNGFTNLMRLAGIGVWVLLILLLASYCFSSRRTPGSNAVIGSCVLVFVSYSAFSVYRFVHNELGPLDSRMMSGIFVPLVVMIIISADRLQPNRPRLLAWLTPKLLGILAISVVSLHIFTMLNDAAQYGREGRYWGTDIHRDVPIHRFAAELPSDSALFSNEPQSLFAATFRWPIRNQYQAAEPPLLPCSRNYMVWFNQTYLPDGKPTGAVVVYEDSWGQVLDLGDCGTDLMRFWP